MRHSITRTATVAALLILSALSPRLSATYAQDVYKEILRLSRETAQDQTKDLQTRRSAMFKVNALEYMLAATDEFLPDSMMTDVVNNQAYALYDFVNTFLTVYNYCEKETDREETIAMFRRVSLANPRFPDTSSELTTAYLDAEGFITRFSLNTDWVRALADVKAILKDKL